VSVSPEVDEFLTTHTRTMLVTLCADGSPTVHPMLALWRDGALWLNAYRKSAKTQNIERDARVCCLVLGGDDDLVPPAVVLHGAAELMPPGTLLPVSPRAVESVPTPRGVTTGIVRKVEDRVATSKRLMFRIAPTRAELIA
jgi:hypothetical protein